MRLPNNEELGDESDPYALVHASIFRRFGANTLQSPFGRHTVTMGVRNLTNSIQAAPLVGSSDPFGENFDASRIYGPMEQRRIFLEWSCSF